MKYAFSDILDSQIFDNVAVMFVAGQYNLFNNMVVDELKDRARIDDGFILDSETLKMFGIESDASSDISNKVDFNSFMEYKDIVNLSGKWFCSVDIKTLNSKQKSLLNDYLKNPSENGILVVTSTDFRDYMFYLKSKIVQNSTKVHLLQLSWPTRTILESIVIALFAERKVRVNNQSAKFFIMRMSNMYDEYEETIERICNNVSEGDLPYEELQQQMKGIENYVVEDFVELMLEPLTNDKTNNKKIYRMLVALINEFGAMRLSKRIIAIAKESIEFRYYINSGYIPVNIFYSFSEVQKSIGDKSDISKLSEYQFRKKAKLASKTSMLDWEYIILILSNVGNRYSDESYEKALYALASRTVLNESRLNNDIGIENILGETIRELNDVRYTCDERKESL